MKLVVKRRPSTFDAALGRSTTYGSLWIDGEIECYTLEDEIREPAERPAAADFAALEAWVRSWKVVAQTAIPAGEYELALRDSPKFGVDSLWIKDVPGFTWVLIHSGVDVDSTEGCVIVGDKVDEGRFEIGGGKARAVLAKLKAKVIRALSRGEPVTIEICNPTEVAA